MKTSQCTVNYDRFNIIFFHSFDSSGHFFNAVFERISAHFFNHHIQLHKTTLNHPGILSTLSQLEQNIQSLYCNYLHFNPLVPGVHKEVSDATESCVCLSMFKYV